MSETPLGLQFSTKGEELDYLLRLADIEMTILGESAGRLAQTLRIPLPLKQCRELLAWKRGLKVVGDFAKLGEHCTRIAVLLKEIESEQESQKN